MKANMVALHCLFQTNGSRDLFQIDFADWGNGFVGTAVHPRQNHFRTSRVGGEA